MTDTPSRPSWFDSHCHLQDEYRSGDADPTDLVREAVDAGVNALVCVGTDASTSREAVELVRSLKDSGLEGSQSEDGSRGVGAFDAWATVGLHPHEASKGTHEIEEVLDRVLEQEPGMVVAVGECGLDYHYDHSPRDSQREAFAKQISLANRLGLALVVHSRSAWDDTLAVLKSEGVPQRTVMHCFTGGTEEARRCLDLGAFLSFSGIVTFKGAADVRAAARFCPSERLLVETDAPFLAPVPHRGATNRPAWVSLVGEAIARERGVAPQTLATSSTAAAYALFRPE